MTRKRSTGRREGDVRWILVLVALSGCGTGGPSEADRQAALRACDRFTANAAWADCYSRTMDGLRAQQREEATRAAQRSRDVNDAAGMLLLGTGAFLDGYNSGGRPTITCTTIGGITTCN
jgi:hypothetical protein